MTLHRYMLNRRLADTTPINGRVLEIGNGRQRRGLATGATTTLDIACARAPHVQADAQTMPFCSSAFDAVICCEVLQYVAWPEYVLRDVRRVLKLGGTLLVSLLFQRLPHKLDKADRLYRWTEGCARDLLACCGFSVTRLTPLWPPWHYYTSGWFVEARAA